MPRLLVLSCVALAVLACSGSTSGGGGGGGASYGGPPEDEPDPGGGRKARGGAGGKAKHRPPDRDAKGKKGGRDGGGGGREGDDDDGRDEDPPDPEPDGFACYAEGVYRVCDVEGKPATCHDETAKAGGPGSTRSEAERNAIEACDAHMDTLVSAADSGKGSAEVRKRCELTTCEG